MLHRFIQVTFGGPSPNSIWINPQYIVVIRPNPDSEGSIITFHDDETATVAEDVPTLLARIAGTGNRNPAP